MKIGREITEVKVYDLRDFTRCNVVIDAREGCHYWKAISD